MHTLHNLNPCIWDKIKYPIHTARTAQKQCRNREFKQMLYSMCMQKQHTQTRATMSNLGGSPKHSATHRTGPTISKCKRMNANKTVCFDGDGCVCYTLHQTRSQPDQHFRKHIEFILFTCTLPLTHTPPIPNQILPLSTR